LSTPWFAISTNSLTDAGGSGSPLVNNLDQVRRYAPPPNFVKETDTRTSGYRDRFGTDECWELDALSPTVIADLIRNEVEGLVDKRRWRASIAHEERGPPTARRGRRELGQGRENFETPAMNAPFSNQITEAQAKSTMPGSAVCVG
jgi:hypothetical protein